MYRPSPNRELRVHPAQRIAAVVDALAEDGVTPGEALEGSDIQPDQLVSDETRVSYRQVEIVFRNAMRLSDDASIAFRAGQKMHVMAYGMYGYALLSSPSRAHGIDFLAKYSRLLGTVADTDFMRDNDRASYRFEPLLSYNPTDTIYRFALEFAFAAFQTLSRDILGPTFTFSALRAAYPAPAHAKLYRRMFQCPVQFDQLGNDLTFDPAWIDRPRAVPARTASVVADELYESLLRGEHSGGSIAADIRRILLEHPGHFPSIEAMASGLSMHPRTLRRKLEAENLTYRQIIAELRMKLAVEYLRRTQMTNEEIAERLDYSDASNFRHAFARWTGKCPSAYRGGAVSL